MTEEQRHVRPTRMRPGLVELGDVLVPEGVTVDTLGHYCEPGEPASTVPLVTARFEVRDGRPECVHLEVTARPGGRGIRLRDLEVFTLDAALEGAFSQFAVRRDADYLAGPSGTSEQIEELRAEARREVAAAKRGRPKTAVAELARVAEVYREHVDGQPLKAVQARLGYQERTAARRVAQAREAGLLPPTTRGVRKA